MEMKRCDAQVEDKTFYFWDYAYYERIWKEAAYSIDEIKISEYFPLQAVLRGMFDIFEAVFGVVFEKAGGDFWHKDVELYSVWDNEENGGAFS